MFTKAFWIATAERAIKTSAQFAGLALGATVWTAVGDVVSTGVAVGLAAAFGAVSSILTSLASGQFGPEGSPSLVPDPAAGGAW